MAYQVIARKWRPQTFEEVTGQEPITRTLRGALEHERLHHAYLFSGARGVGKTTTARLLAKALNCHKSKRPTATPCKTTDADQCASCREVAEGRSIDVLEIDAASNTGVDNVRDSIINTVGVNPARDRYKVFIIDEVHMLSGAAFNALLKTLEEPPPRVVFIMATTESHKIPDTILSRSQQFEFRTIATARIAERLRLIADAEGVKVADLALREIARAGEGSMRDAQSAFDQVISFSDGGEITVEDVEAALGIAGAELRARVMRSIAVGAPQDALAVVDDLVMRGHDLRNFCRDLLSHIRDLLVVKVAGDAAEGLDAGDVERRELMHAAREFSESDLVRFFHSLTETERTLREGAHPRYQLEIGLVKLIEMRRLVPLAQIIERLGALEEALRTGRAPVAGVAGTSAPPGGTAAGGGSAPRGSSGGGRGAPPVSRASASAADEAGREPFAASSFDGAASAASSANASPSQVNNAAKPGARQTADSFPVNAKASADSFTPNAGSADDVPPWEAPPWEEPPMASHAPLKLVPPPAPPGEVTTQAQQSASAAATQAGSTSAALSTVAVSSVSSQTHAPGVFAGDSQPMSVSSTGDFVERIKTGLEERRKPFLSIALEGARKVSIEGEELYVEFAPDAKHLRDNLAKPESVKLLREVCESVCGREMGVRISVRDKNENRDDEPPSEQARDAEAEERRRLRQLAENHPSVQQVLRAFQAEIVDVRRVDSTK
ncbi:MAG TPA: DNA polymerase III subunit gamma/tau [Pyrinomonadaceae bacterium]|nr:DNA polymerase III subunit gamma/tau [Pyrinomonadaceae bacterium]